MPRGISNAKQLAMMSSVLEDFCSSRGIVDAGARDELGLLILEMFDKGARTAGELTAALERHHRRMTNT